MAQFAVHGTWRSVSALAAFFAFVGLLAFGLAGGFPEPAHMKVSMLGLALYGLAFLSIVLGFWSKEDTIAVGGIIGISLLMILDILLRVGVLSYNGIKIIH